MGKKRFFNFKNLFFVSFLAVAGIFSAGAYIANKQVEEVPLVEKAEAGSKGRIWVDFGAWTNSKQYCKNISDWHMHAWQDGQAGTNYNFNAFKNYQGRDLVYIDNVPDNVTRCIVYCWNMNENINKVQEMSFVDGQSMLIVEESTTSRPQHAHWTSFDKVYTKSNMLPCSDSNARIFFIVEGTAWADNVTAVRAWGGTAGSADGYTVDGTIYVIVWFQDDGDGKNWYGYVTIPTNVNGFNFITINSDSQTASIQNYQQGNSYTIGDDTFTSMYFAYKDGGDDDSHISISKVEGGVYGDGNKIGRPFFTHLLESYRTCYSGKYCGYGDGSRLLSGWYAKATDDAKSLIVASRGGTSASVTTHITAMAARASGGSNSAIRDFTPFKLVFDDENNLSTIIIIIASSVSLLSITALSVLLVKKRKRNEQ